MSPKTIEISQLVEMLPETEQNFAYEFVKRLVLAWDPDFTKLTSSEKDALEKAQLEFDRGDYVSIDDIDWN